MLQRMFIQNTRRLDSYGITRFTDWRYNVTTPVKSGLDIIFYNA
jgi:hypothetical protein